MHQYSAWTMSYRFRRTRSATLGRHPGMAAVEVVMRVMARPMEEEVLGAPELSLSWLPRGLIGVIGWNARQTAAQMRV